MSIVTEAERAHYESEGWLLRRDLLSLSVAQLSDAVDAVASLPAERCLHHYERTEHGPALARTERFLEASPALAALLGEGPVAEVASALLGERAAIYKEKINYKRVGGAGFSPHQDLPAYPGVPEVLSVMIAIDDSRLDNGCLVVSSGRHDVIYPQDEQGCLRTELVESLAWTPVELAAGDTLFFSGLLPHRSGPNHSAHDRRALYPTYHRASLGELRSAYYAEKAATLAARGPGDRVPLSLIGDFEGVPL